MAKKCCPECFGDRELRERHIPTLSQQRGTCDYCGSENCSLVDPEQLRDLFEALLNIYQHDADGAPLIEWLKKDWILFDHPCMDDATIEKLISKILDNDKVVQKKYISSKRYASDGLSMWSTLRNELLHKNRYFLDETRYKKWLLNLGNLLNQIPAVDIPDIWFRTRIMSDDTPFELNQMGAPPERLAKFGRANPAGIPYLYLSSDQKTSISELRPHTGEQASVAKFILQKPIKAIDLRNPRKLVSPFPSDDISSPGQLRADIPFLERLGEELTRPVLPRSAAIDYIPSQYLCEFIKKSGYDGVVYRSSVSEGMNLALFDPSKAEPQSVELYNIHRVTVDVSKEGSRSVCT